jgi:hypothetical protein
MNELMQQTHAGLAAHDRRLLREIRRLVDDVRRIGAEMDIASAARIDLRKCLISECSSLGRRCHEEARGKLDTRLASWGRTVGRDVRGWSTLASLPPGQRDHVAVLKSATVAGPHPTH